MYYHGRDLHHAIRTSRPLAGGGGALSLAAAVLRGAVPDHPQDLVLRYRDRHATLSAAVRRLRVDRRFSLAAGFRELCFSDGGFALYPVLPVVAADRGDLAFPAASDRISPRR